MVVISYTLTGIGNVIAALSIGLGGPALAGLSGHAAVDDHWLVEACARNLQDYQKLPVTKAFLA